jgi:cobalt transporter subunit CbtA
MFRRVFLAAILAGVAAGLFCSLIQHLRVTPYILAAEVFETASPEHAHASNGHGQPATASAGTAAAEPWAPAEGVERTLYTVLANLVVSTAFALALAGASLLLGVPVTLANGALWGLCGFLALSLAPAAGLPPELPGMAAADLWSRQIWWWFTAAMTAVGLALAAKRPQAGSLALAALIIALPHIIGAPQTSAHESNLPAHLASGFAANALATAAVLWVSLGLVMGFINERAQKGTSS